MRLVKIKNIILSICLLFLLPNLVFANSYDSIEYNLSVANTHNKPVLAVETIIKGKFQDKLILNLPAKWAGISYVEQIKNIKSSDAQDSTKAKALALEVIKNDNTHQAIITLPHVTNQIQIRYEIHQKQNNPANVYEAMIRNDVVHSPGYGIFITLSDLQEKDKIHTIINWRSIDSDWKTLSSHGINKTIDRTMTFPELLHAIYVAGKTRLYNIGDHTSPVFLSLYGYFDISDHQIVSHLKEVISSQRTFFNDFEFPYYAISLIEGDNPSLMGGTRLHQSFTAFLPKETETTDYYLLFAHEHLHNWIGGKIANNHQEEALNYWWTEGFTEFYSKLIALRSGGIDTKTFITEANQLLRNYYLSPLNREPNARILKDFWNNNDVQHLPYDRGFVFAIYLNDMIKNNSKHSLDDVMRDLFENKIDSHFSPQLFINLAQKYISHGIHQEIASFIDQGNLITLEKIKLPIEKVLMGRYALGFDRDSTLKNGVIQNVDINSNAYQAGIRNQQKILGYDIPPGKNPNQIITIKTTAGDFQFKPEHNEKVEVFQIITVLSEIQSFFWNKIIIKVLLRSINAKLMIY